MRKFIFIIIAIAACLFSFLYFQTPFNIIRPVFHAETIEASARQAHLDPLLVTSLIKVESNFLTRARSHRGAVGLMQLMPSTADELADELGYKHFRPADLENPEINIKLGTYYLGKLHTTFNGNEILTLAAYNAGRGKVETWYRQNPLIAVEISDIPYKETRNYVTSVTGTYQCLKKIQSIKNFLQGKKAH
jgi:soluble lytic murein transglycosylase